MHAGKYKISRSSVFTNDTTVHDTGGDDQMDAGEFAAAVSAILDKGTGYQYLLCHPLALSFEA